MSSWSVQPLPNQRAVEQETRAGSGEVDSVPEATSTESVPKRLVVVLDRAETSSK